MAIRWQDSRKITGGISVSVFFAIMLVLNMSGMSFEGKAYSLLEDCSNETFTRDVNTVVEISVDCSGNSSCKSPQNSTVWTKQDYDVETCEEKGVRIGNTSLTFKGVDKNCLRTDDRVCCWCLADVGSNLEHRGYGYRTIIRSGERGRCFNLTGETGILTLKSKWGDTGC